MAEKSGINDIIPDGCGAASYFILSIGLFFDLIKWHLLPMLCSGGGLLICLFFTFIFMIDSSPSEETKPTAKDTRPKPPPTPDPFDIE